METIKRQPGSDNDEPEKNNNPQKAITTPAEVEESKDAKIDQDFEGYPHYPAKDEELDPKK